MKEDYKIPPYYKCTDTRYLVLTRNIRIAGRNFPANSIVTQYDGIIYVCDHFPDYKGDARNVILKIWTYDTTDILPEWQRDIIGANSINYSEKTLARKLWIAHLENGHARTHRVRQPENIDFNRMMRSANTRKKSGGSGKRLIPGAEEKDFGMELEWREHSVYAHWAFSGDASMVALSARYEQNERKL